MTCQARRLLPPPACKRTYAGELKNGGNIEAAKRVGTAIASKAVASGIKAVAFDRSGRRYHGRIKALADAARKGGLSF